MSQAGIVVKQVSTGGAISSSSGEKKKILMLGVLGEEGKKIILCKIPSERFFPHLADWPATQPGTAWQRGGGRRRRKKTTTKKNPTRRHKHLVHLSKPFLNLSKKRRTIQSRSLRWLPLLFWTGPYWFRIKSQIDWAKQLERFRLVLRDHFCRGVFFFRFRLKKQQHLQKDVDVKWARGWEKHEKEQTRQCVKYHRSLIWVLFLCLLNQNSKNSVTP